MERSCKMHFYENSQNPERAVLLGVAPVRVRLYRVGEPTCVLVGATAASVA